MFRPARSSLKDCYTASTSSAPMTSSSFPQYSFTDDYSDGTHPAIVEALTITNPGQQVATSTAPLQNSISAVIWGTNSEMLIYNIWVVYHSC
ncbi:hypothetical protein BJX99DRAFT_233169 [Aspergillus californicus]